MGTMFERSPSAPRLIVTCRKLGSSRRPIAPSVRKTNRPSEVIFRMSRLLSIHASTLCSNGRSIRGGHISTLRRNFFEAWSALRSDMEGVFSGETFRIPDRRCSIRPIPKYFTGLMGQYVGPRLSPAGSRSHRLLGFNLLGFSWRDRHFLAVVLQRSHQFRLHSPAETVGRNNRCRRTETEYPGS